MICVYPHGYSFLIYFLNASFKENARVLLLFILLIFISLLRILINILSNAVL